MWVYSCSPFTHNDSGGVVVVEVVAVTNPSLLTRSSKQCRNTFEWVHLLGGAYLSDSSAFLLFSNKDNENNHQHPVT